MSENAELQYLRMQQTLLRAAKEAWTNAKPENEPAAFVELGRRINEACKPFTPTPAPADDRRAPLEVAEAKCRDIGRLIGSQLPRGWGFTLILADFQMSGGFLTYVSNCQRDGMIKLLRETALKIEKGVAEV